LDARTNTKAFYTLAVGNLITGAMNVAADLGVPVVTGDLVMEV
jgi:hypothetical protein